jgi:hypothetical protein
VLIAYIPSIVRESRHAASVESRWFPLCLPGTQANICVHESHKPLYLIQDGLNLELNSWPLGPMVFWLGKPRLIESAGVQLFFCLSIPSFSWADSENLAVEKTRARPVAVKCTASLGLPS